MKFTKLFSSALVSATVLSVLAPATAMAATEEGNAAANGGQELPQTADTYAAISFGDPTAPSNKGYLRLQYVPSILDFGNHTQFMSSFPTFTAAGVNMGNAANDRFASYDGTKGNKTPILNTGDEKLADVKGKVWATVVDKQTTRATNDGNNTAASGTWSLDVKANGPLVVEGTDGSGKSETIDDANLTFGNTAYGRTLDVYNLVTGTNANDQQDKGYADRDVSTDDDTDIAAAGIQSNISLQLTDGSATQNVAKAADGEGQGADVFGWDRSDVQLTLPQSATVKNGIYSTTLTWTLSTGDTKA